MQKIISKLRSQHPSLRFKAGKQFYWSPETGDIFYNSESNSQDAIWSLLHETGHALLNHNSYRSDLELLRLEVIAWEKARQLGADLRIDIDEGHIQDCLDTYRDWLHKRSICPNCTTKSLQLGDFVHYRCFNCHAVWKVSTDRFCRAYRSSKTVLQPIIFHDQNE